MLTDETAKCFDHEKLRALYVAVQVISLDLKVDFATNNTMRFLKVVVTQAARMTPTLFGKYHICTAVVDSFAIRSVTFPTAKVVESVLWEIWATASVSSLQISYFQPPLASFFPLPRLFPLFPLWSQLTQVICLLAI